MTVEDKGPFMHFPPHSDGEGYSALLGFRVVNTMPTNGEGQIVSSNLFNALYRSGVTALELRMTKRSQHSAIATSLLCHLQYVPEVEARIFPGFCRMASQQVRFSFWDWGFEIEPYTDEVSLLQVLNPFKMRASAKPLHEGRELALQEASLYGSHKVYTSYLWEWSETTPQALAEILAQQSGRCSVSIYLRPIQLDEERQVCLERVTSLNASLKLRDTNWMVAGEADVYQMFVRKSDQTYLIQIVFAGASEWDLGQLRQTLNRQLPMGSVMEPVVQLPEDGVQKRFTWQDFSSPEWIRWEDRYGDESENR